jgi:hypothetical protein
MFIDEAWKSLCVLLRAAEGVVRREDTVARLAAGMEDNLLGRAELEKHVLMALTLPLGIANRPLAEPEAHVRADESILQGYKNDCE